MRSSAMVGAPALASAAAAADPRVVMYIDQWRTINWPEKTQMDGINYVINDFVNATLFSSEPASEYKPSKTLEEARDMFANGTKFCMAIGGWGNTAGLGEGVENDNARSAYVKNIATAIESLGYDCIDMSWEKTSEIEMKSYPKLLKEIKRAIGDKELAISIPGLQRDMLAYTRGEVPEINKWVDFLMTYDLTDRRDNVTKDQSLNQSAVDVVGSYIDRGFDASKLTVGISFYTDFSVAGDGYSCSGTEDCAAKAFEGGQISWAWDTPELSKKKLDFLRDLGVSGITAWSPSEGIYDWSDLKALQEAVTTYSAKNPKLSMPLSV